MRCLCAVLFLELYRCASMPIHPRCPSAVCAASWSAERVPHLATHSSHQLAQMEKALSEKDQQLQGKDTALEAALSQTNGQSIAHRYMCTPAPVVFAYGRVGSWRVRGNLLNLYCLLSCSHCSRHVVSCWNANNPNSLAGEYKRTCKETGRDTALGQDDYL